MSRRKDHLLVGDTQFEIWCTHGDRRTRVDRGNLDPETGLPARPNRRLLLQGKAHPYELRGSVLRVAWLCRKCGQTAEGTADAFDNAVRVLGERGVSSVELRLLAAMLRGE